MKLIDLTMVLEHGQPGVEFQAKFTLEKDGWNARTLKLYSHTGTHMDAPVHFGVNDKTIDQIPLERLFVRGHLVDVPIEEPSGLIHPTDVADQLEDAQPGDAVLLHTRWSQHFGQPIYREGLPRISETLARDLVDRKIGIIGVEGPSVADVNNLEEVTLIHQILLGADIVIVEGLTNLEAITSTPFTFGAMPLKVGGGDGTPCRAFAILDGQFRPPTSPKEIL